MSISHSFKLSSALLTPSSTPNQIKLITSSTNYYFFFFALSLVAGAAGV
jgi:hypothetical protein